MSGLKANMAMNTGDAKMRPTPNIVSWPNTFAISKLLGGGMTYLIGDMIENLFTVHRNWNYGSTISLILMVMIIASLALLRKVDPDNEGGGMW